MLGAVTVTYNDGYKIEQLRAYYNEIKEVIDHYVIVDNGSSDNYRDQVKAYFPKAELICLEKNCGTTGAYNRGIELLLNKFDCEFIMIYGNDVRVSPADIRSLIDYLGKHKDVGMITSVLLQKDCSVVADAGCYINKKELSLTVKDAGKDYSSIEHTPLTVEAVTGGFNIASAEFYRTVGLQDERLFMYSDEVDMGIRAKEKNYQMVILRNTVAWHQHINPPGKAIRHPYSAYLMARNKIYLAYKHISSFSALRLFVKYLYRDLIRVIYHGIKRNAEKTEWHRWHMIGAFYGLRKDMEPNQYSSL